MLLYFLFRIIPTYVGSTGIQLSYSTRGPNHSHVCGINHRPHKGNICILESFPRMWDQLKRAFFVWVLYANHSHVCGINRDASARASGSFESFPRMWDQLIKRLKSMETDRIIPTYVGSTWNYMYIPAHAANHSHVCGINQTARSQLRVIRESFPRMWDQRYRVFAVSCSRRIIPTYVGSTQLNPQQLQTISNHSHVCGIN